MNVDKRQKQNVSYKKVTQTHGRGKLMSEVFGADE